MNYQLTKFKQSPSSIKRQHLGSIENIIAKSVWACSNVTELINPGAPQQRPWSHAFNLYWFPLSVWGVVIYNCLILFTIIGKKNFKGGSLEFNIRLRKSPNNIDFSWVLQEPRHLLWSSCFTGHNALRGFNQKDTCSLKSSCQKVCPWYKVLQYLHHLLFSLYWYEEACIDIKDSISYSAQCY